MEPDGRDRSGNFNWINLLVLVAVLAILVGLLIPAIPPPGRQGPLCNNHLRNISTALLSYENSHGQYPGYANILMTAGGKPYVDPHTGKVVPVSFVVPILQMLDRPDIYRAWTARAGVTGSMQKNADQIGKPKVRLDILECPSDPAPDRRTPSNSYVINCGMKDGPGLATMPRDWADNGVFFDLFTGDPRVAGANSATKIVTMSNAWIARHDGLQNTLLMSENVDAGVWTDTDEARIGMLWNADGSIDQAKSPPHLVPPHASMQINHGIGSSETDAGRKLDPTIFARPSSYHPGGVNVAFCDGRVQFLSDQIDYYVYCLLMLTNGQRVRKPGSNRLIPGFDVKDVEHWLNR